MGEDADSGNDLPRPIGRYQSSGYLKGRRMSLFEAIYSNVAGLVLVLISLANKHVLGHRLDGWLTRLMVKRRDRWASQAARW